MPARLGRDGCEAGGPEHGPRVGGRVDRGGRRQGVGPLVRGGLVPARARLDGDCEGLLLTGGGGRGWGGAAGPRPLARVVATFRPWGGERTRELFVVVQPLLLEPVQPRPVLGRVAGHAELLLRALRVRAQLRHVPAVGVLVIHEPLHPALGPSGGRSSQRLGRPATPLARARHQGPCAGLAAAPPHPRTAHCSQLCGRGRGHRQSLAVHVPLQLRNVGHEVFQEIEAFF